MQNLVIFTLVFLSSFNFIKGATPNCRDTDDKRYSLGEEWTQYCHSFRCESNGARLVTAGCERADGTCYGVGETYNYYCYVYRCELEGGRRPRRKKVSTACSYYNQCIPVGNKIQHGRRDYTCREMPDGRLTWERGTSKAENRPTCTAPSGERVLYGNRFIDGCNTFKCDRVGTGYRLVVERTGCLAADGSCKNTGSRDFSCEINGARNERCKCEENGGDLPALVAMAVVNPTDGEGTSAEDFTRQGQKGCLGPDGSLVKPDNFYIFNCEHFKCQLEGLDYALKMIAKDCKTADDTCVRLGTSDFACKIGGVRQERCKCQLGRNHEIEYTALPTSCRAPDGSRVDILSSFKDVCTTYRCEKNGQLKRRSEECITFDNDCVAPGTKDFPCLVRGMPEQHCACVSEDDRIRYYLNGCKAQDGTFVAPGQDFTHNCTEYKCLETNGEFSLESQRRDCINADGGCERLGSNDFACIIDGVRYDSCKCLLGLDGYPRYLINMVEKPVAKMENGCSDANGMITPEGGRKTIDCIDFQCVRDGDAFKFDTVRENCKETNGRCLPIGSANFECVVNGKQYSNCKCEADSRGKASLAIIPEGCTAEDGTFVPLDDSIVVDCTAHKCSKEGGKNMLQPTGVECKTADDTCVPVGSTGFPCIIEGTRYPKCTCGPDANGELKYMEMEEKAGACDWHNGEKVPLGTRMTFDCTEHQCTEENGRFIMKPVSVACKAADGTCVPPGSKDFECMISGSNYPSCSCALGQDGRLTYSANPTECILGTGERTKIGETITKNCRDYKCVSEAGTLKMMHVRSECITFDKQCVPVGHQDFTCENNGQPVEHCSCRETLEGNIQYFVDGCIMKNGTYVATGDTITINCAQYKCNQKEGGYGLDLDGRECMTYDGECVPVGEKDFTCNINGKATDHCSCEAGAGNNIRYFVDGCVITDGRYVATGDTITLDCAVYRCSKSDIGYSLEFESKECKTAENTCVPVGSKNFPCLMNGVRQPNCQCKSDTDGTILYSAQPTECVLRDGRKAAEGETLEVNCTTYSCSKQGNALGFIKAQVRCQTADGDCMPMDSVNFPCVLAGKRYPGCKCELDFDNSIIYSLYGCLTIDGTFVSLDDTYTKDCTEYICTKSFDQFVLEPAMTDCKSTDGQCYPVGTDIFPCEGPDGTQYDRCKCVRGDGGKVYTQIQLPTTAAPEEPTTTTAAPTTTTTTTTEAPSAAVQASDRKTAGGTGEGKNCVFPFIYDGYEYDDCTTYGDDHSRPWCSTTGNFDNDGKKGFCKPKKEPVLTTGGEPCVFPFSYGGALYYECIPKTWSGAWCATTYDYDNDDIWDYCDGY
ncbi:uncharacterized protein LOC135490691 isoform X2 [Lineus longissimus]|uniref:uncharacterized protein LOC135490691 isoform X2 n=1 Tax=Lineus longissimus TaxID=88925 RepID=UPI00315C702A